MRPAHADFAQEGEVAGERHGPGPAHQPHPAQANEHHQPDSIGQKNIQEQQRRREERQGRCGEADTDSRMSGFHPFILIAFLPEAKNIMKSPQILLCGNRSFTLKNF